MKFCLTKMKFFHFLEILGCLKRIIWSHIFLWIVGISMLAQQDYLVIVSPNWNEHRLSLAGFCWKEWNARMWLSAAITVKHSFLVVGRRRWGVGGGLVGSETKKESTNQDYCQQRRRLMATGEWISVCLSNAGLTWSAAFGEKEVPQDNRDYTASTFY